MKKLHLTDTYNSKVWFTSDTHYMHKNICRGTSNWEDLDSTRPFKTLHQMNQQIVEGINALVGEDDILVHLGDWSFGGYEMVKEFRNLIVCKNIHLVLGNHDHHIDMNRDNLQDLFSSVSHMLEISIDQYATLDGGPLNVEVQACHYPMMSWKDMNKGAMHLHGHCHLPPDKVHAGKGRIMDVGMDGNGMLPIAFRRISSILMARFPVSSLPFEDHHSKKTR